MGKFSTTYEGVARYIVTTCKIAGAGKAMQSRNNLRECTAIWDTGASTTIISREVAECLKLDVIGTMPVNTIGGKQAYQRSKIDIYLPTKQIIHFLDVIVGELSNCDILIGMDLITLGDFALSTTKGRTTFYFETPSRGIEGYTVTETKETPKWVQWLTRKLSTSASITRQGIPTKNIHGKDE